MKETTVKMNKTKRWFYEKIKKKKRKRKTLAKFIKNKSEKNQINKIRIEKG